VAECDDSFERNAIYREQFTTLVLFSVGFHNRGAFFPFLTDFGCLGSGGVSVRILFSRVLHGDLRSQHVLWQYFFVVLRPFSVVSLDIAVEGAFTLPLLLVTVSRVLPLLT